MVELNWTCKILPPFQHINNKHDKSCTQNINDKQDRSLATFSSYGDELTIIWMHYLCSTTIGLIPHTRTWAKVAATSLGTRTGKNWKTENQRPIPWFCYKTCELKFKALFPGFAIKMPEFSLHYYCYSSLSVRML